MSDRSDVAVVGAGIVGLSVADALLTRGVDVALFDDGAPGQGQSAGAGRVFRRLHDDAGLVSLAGEAEVGWRQWGARAGEELLERGGWLRRGGDRDADLAKLAPDASELDAAAALERLPAIAPAPGPLLFDPRGGALRAAAAVRALVDWTSPSLRRSHVSAIAVRDDGVRLATTDGQHRCRRCLVCAGAGSDRLAASVGDPLHQHRRAHVRLTFALRRPAERPLPAWSDRSGDFGELVYGVQADRGAYALGIADLRAYPPVASPARSAPAGVDLDPLRSRIAAYARAAFPGLRPEPVGEVARLTTTLSSGDDDGFALRWTGPVGVFAGGNLFKFAPVLGARLAEAVLSEERRDWSEPAAVPRRPAEPLVARPRR